MGIGGRSGGRMDIMIILDHGKRFFDYACKYANCDVNYSNAPWENLIAGKYYCENLKNLLTHEQKVVKLIDKEINRRILEKIKIYEQTNPNSKTQ
jgi:hypothetical protein